MIGFSILVVDEVQPIETTSELVASPVIALFVFLTLLELLITNVEDMSKFPSYIEVVGSIRNVFKVGDGVNEKKLVIKLVLKMVLLIGGC